MRSNRKIFNGFFILFWMLNDLLKEVVSMIVGKPAEGIVDLINSKNHVNEFLIAKKMDLTINQTRNLLYRIADHGLVSYVKKKDKKKGWYTYFWKLEIIKVLEFLEEILKNRIKNVEEEMRRRQNEQFYLCERCKIEIDQEKALDINFECPECGDILVLKDVTKDLRDLKRYHNKFLQELEEVQQEIEKERTKLDKVRDRIIKKDKKEKAEKRAKTRAANKKIRDATKKSGEGVKKAAGRTKSSTSSSKNVERKKKTSKKKVAKKKTTKKSVKKKVAKKVVKKKAAKKIVKKKVAKKVTGRTKSSTSSSKKVERNKKVAKKTTKKKSKK